MEFESNVCWCGQVQDTLGVHALCCFAWWQLDQEACDLVNNLLATMCDAANIPFLKEHVHDFEEDANLRPDIVLLCHTPAGCDVALDVCVRVCVTTPTCASIAGNDTLQQDGQLPPSEEQGNGKKNKQEKKNMRHAQDKCLFNPVVFSTCGGTTSTNINMVLDLIIIRRITKRRFCSPNWAAPDKRSHWFQRIAVALWNGVTSCGTTHTSNLVQRSLMRDKQRIPSERERFDEKQAMSSVFFSLEQRVIHSPRSFCFPFLFSCLS